MSHWLYFLPTALTAVLIVLAPGLVVGWVLRLRGILLWGFAPAAGTAAIAVSATLLGIIGVQWSWWSASLAVLVLIIIAALIGWAARPVRIRLRVSRPSILIFAVVIGTLIGMARMALLIGSPQNLSQTNDATFHLNALRFISESGSASSLDILGTLGTTGFYPAAWHSIASLVMELCGVGPVAAANATALVIAGPIWTLSITSFVWCVTRGSRLAAVAAAVMSPVLFAFPLAMLDFGILYPYALAVAVLPGVLALLVHAVSAGSGGEASVSSRRAWLVIASTAVGIAALGLSQPSVVLIWITGALCVAVLRLTEDWKTANTRQRRRRIGMIAAALLVGAGLWLTITRMSSSMLWGPRMPLAAALTEMLVNNSIGPGPSIIMSLLSIIGFVIAVRVGRLRWFALFSGTVVFLTAVALSVQNEAIRGLLAAWYADPQRFVALMPLIVIPLASVAVAEMSSRMRRMRGPVLSGGLVGVLLAAVIAEMVVWTLVPAERRSNSYDLSASSYLSIDEEALLKALPRYVGPDDRILGNPSTGAAFGYALSGRDVVPRTWSMPADEDFQELRWGLADIADDPAVCAAVDRMGIDYALDFGKSATGAGKWKMPGLTGFSTAKGFEKVAQIGEASLWRVTGC